MDTFRDIIDLWPQRKQMAEDINVPAESVRNWYRSNAIPAKYWSKIISAGSDRGHVITAENLTLMAGRKFDGRSSEQSHP